MDYWYIWFEVFEDNKKIGSGVWHQSYRYKANAVRRAKQMWSEDRVNPMTGTTIKYQWIVSRVNPWKDVYICKTRAEAEDLIWQLKLLAERYGCVTRKDVMDLLSNPTDKFLDKTYIWFHDSIKQAHINVSGSMYLVEMPRAVPMA